MNQQLIVVFGYFLLTWVSIGYAQNLPVSSASISEPHGRVHDSRIKPRSIKRSLHIPSQKSVKKIGGVKYGKHVDITLSDGVLVRCFPAATEDPSQQSKIWYFLPTQAKVSRGKDGQPKFSMMRFVSDEVKETGGSTGAILHILVEYGLTPDQRRETERLLRKTVPYAVLEGAVPLEVGAEGNSFSIVSASLSDHGLTPTVITSGKAPVMEGRRAAVSARLDAYAAMLLIKSLENPTTDISVVFDLKYVVKLPAYDVTVMIDYQRYHDLGRDYTNNPQGRFNGYHPFKLSTRAVTSLSKGEKQQIVDGLIETGIVKIDYMENLADGEMKILKLGIHKLILDTFFDMQNRMGSPSREELGEGLKATKPKPHLISSRYGGYQVLQRKELSRRSKQVLKLSELTARYDQHQMVGNLGQWYTEFKDDPRVISEVNLSDPFFQHHEVRIVIDHEAYDIFNQIANYATVQVRVPRKNGRPYIEEITINRQHLEKHGQSAKVTFPAVDDVVQDFEYLTQWSLRGGVRFPTKPSWKKGNFMAVTLKAPVRPTVVEIETDLEVLRDLNINSVSVELRYQRFRNVFRDQEGLSLPSTGGEPVNSKIIYHDVSNDRLDYRLVYDHEKLGLLQDTTWQTVEDGYIYCYPSQGVRRKIKDLINIHE